MWKGSMTADDPQEHEVLQCFGKFSVTLQGHGHHGSSLDRFVDVGHLKDFKTME
jgi:hypothetical protein